MKIIKKIVAFFSKKTAPPAPPEVERLGIEDYDKLVDSKLKKIHECINQNIESRDGDKVFDKELSDAFLRYQNAIKTTVAHIGLIDSNVIYKRPLNILGSYVSYRTSSKPKKIVWYKRFTRKRIKRWFTKLYRRTKFKVQLYYQHIMLIREIRKMKKIFPMVSNQQAFNLINASKLNKQMIENHI